MSVDVKALITDNRKMSDEQLHIEDLFSLWMNGQASKEQEAELMRLLGEIEDPAYLEKVLGISWQKLDNLIQLSDEKIEYITQKSLGKDLNRSSSKLRPVHYLRKWWWAAAAVLFIATAGGYFLFRNNHETALISHEDSKEIAPGKEGAILTLADGSRVVLDSLGDGLVATQNGSQVILKNGQVTYDGSGAAKAAMVYNTISTPRGRQYQLKLEDGTLVWLNAASSISYPTQFSGPERKVSITGEAYFEVASDKTKPFIVKTISDEIHVLGTSFNVNAYEDEKMVRTTLVSGRVKIGNIELNPGQAYSKGKIIAANIEQDIAWKNGLFQFNNTPLETIMRQVGRWYNVDVVFVSGASREINGIIPRNLPLKSVLKILEVAGRVQFRIDDNKITVTQNAL